jgi:hypothetical protein
MDVNNKKEFAAVLGAVLQIHRQDSTADVMRLWFAALEQYPMEQVRQAFGMFIKSPQGKYPPVPSVIIEILDQMNPDGRVGADEAWAMYPHDEADSAVITDEMAEAMRVARPLLDARDKIGARMAFKEAYTRIVDSNRFKGIKPKWFPSLGHSIEGREQALKQAAELGRISYDHVSNLLPAPSNGILEKALPELKRLTSDEKLTEEQREKNRARLAEIKAMLSPKKAVA